MLMRVKVQGVRRLADGIWLAEVSNEDLGMLGGRPGATGERSVVLVNEPLEADGELEFDRAAAVVINLGSTADTVLIRGQRNGSMKVTEIDSSTRTAAGLASDARVFWVSVGVGRQPNFEIAMKTGVWGVPERNSTRLIPVREGDYVVFYGKEVGFALCRVESKSYRDTSSIWPDHVYPKRVRVSKPIVVNGQIQFSDIFNCLRDRRGIPYRSGQAAGRGVSGGAGVFRRLEKREIDCLFTALGWEEIPPRASEPER